MKVYGPYKGQKGRKHVILIYDDGSRKTISYAKFIWESVNGTIPTGYEVDHINNDLTDDRIENLQLLSKSDNIRKAKKPVKVYKGVCSVCNTEFERNLCQVERNLRKTRAGPFCSRSCAGYYNAMMQHYNNLP